MKTALLKLSEIVTTAGTQVRACLDTSTVDDYATAMVDGAKFPPVVVFHDGSRYILADGFHRVMAATRNGFKDIEAEVHKGAKPDALKFALSANSAHGLKRTPADKRRSIVLALTEWPTLSDSAIAKICAVSHPIVADERRGLVQLEKISGSSKRIGADGRTRNVPQKKDQPQNLGAGKEPTQIVNESKEAPQPAPISIDAKWKEAVGGSVPVEFVWSAKTAKTEIEEWAKKQAHGRTFDELDQLHKIANHVALFFRIEKDKLSKSAEQKTA